MAAVPDALSKVFSRIDDEQERFIADLAEAVKIKSVSAWIQNREVLRYRFISPVSRLIYLGPNLIFDEFGEICSCCC